VGQWLVDVPAVVKPLLHDVAVVVVGSGRPATEVLLDGMTTVGEIADHMLSTFDAALEAHAAKQLK
jgi:hypothetical protein